MITSDERRWMRKQMPHQYLAKEGMKLDEKTRENS
jgi:hypothetical protein